MTTSQLLLALPALALVIGLALLAGRSARAFGLAPRPGQGGRIETVQAVALDSRRRLHLIRCDGRHLLVLTGGSTDLLLGWLEPATAPEPGP